MPPAPTAENKASMVSVAEAQLEIAQRNLGDAEVKAPFDGVVGERIANQGESLPIDGKILALLDTSHVEVAAQMPAADVVRLKVGQPATVTLEGFGDREFQGRITRISPTAQPARARSRSMSRSATATTRCAAACSPWARSSSPRRAMRSPCRPPPCARTTQGDYVLAIENGVLVRKPVGAVRTWSRGELVEVKGLESGMTIVSAPLPGLKAGQPVKVLEARVGRPDA